jgi:patatin-like phospholipase/acyl hydrolase
VDFYLEDGPKIFVRSRWRTATTLGGLVDEKYAADQLEHALRRRLGEGSRLSETLLPVLVPAYDIERRRPFLFRTRSAQRPPRPGETYDYPLWQVGRATSAAPTYFEPCLLEPSRDERYSLIDGGVYANNPSMCAWADVRAQYPARAMIVVSLGTGELCRPILHSEASGWGLASWARPVLDVMFDGTSDVVDHQLGQLLGGAYHRFQVRLDEGMDDLDDASRTNLRALRLRA